MTETKIVYKNIGIIMTDFKQLMRKGTNTVLDYHWYTGMRGHVDDIPYF